MSEATNFIAQHDGYKTKIYPCYTNQHTVRGSVLILHGMAEHHARFLEFAAVLCDAGYDVYLYDHRGHGTDKKIEELGYFDAHDGAEKVITDAIEVLKYVILNNRGSRVFLFAHSMGSIIGRNLIARFDEIDGVIFSGTSAPPAFITFSGKLIANLVTLFRGAHRPGYFLNNLMFGTKAYTKGCERTKYDWLTRNNTIVGAYINDPFCGFLCTNSFYRDLVTLTYNAGQPRKITKTRRDLPILFASGENDPVGDFGKGVKNLYDLYLSLGFSAVSLKLYPDCRHEILNELNNEAIMEDLLSFYESI